MEAQAINKDHGSIAGAYPAPVEEMSTFRLVLEYVVCDYDLDRIHAIENELIKRGKIKDASELDAYYNDQIVDKVWSDWADIDEPQAAND